MIGSLLNSYIEALTEKGILEDLSQLPTQRQMVRILSIAFIVHLTLRSCA